MAAALRMGMVVRRTARALLRHRASRAWAWLLQSTARGRLPLRMAWARLLRTARVRLPLRMAWARLLRMAWARLPLGLATALLRQVAARLGVRTSTWLEAPARALLGRPQQAMAWVGLPRQHWFAQMAVAGRPQTERHKDCSEKKRKSGQHLCPICKEYRHHWQKCKKGNKDDIAALMDVREPPNKRRKTTKSVELSIVPRGDEAPAAAMYFPPSQSLETTTKKGKHTQPLETTNKKNGKGCKRKGKGHKEEDGAC